MRILGVDPGTHTMGFGVLDAAQEPPRCLAWGCLTATRSDPLPQRLFDLQRQLQAVVAEWQPDHLAVEEPFVNPERGAKSAVAVGQAQAVALLLAVGADMQIYQYAPSQVKRAVSDYGAGTKAQVQRMVQMLLGLEPKPMPDDASDALAIALCHLREWQAAQRVRPA